MTIELAALRFQHEGVPLGYRTVVGEADPSVLAPRLGFYPDLSQWPAGQSSKEVFGGNTQIEAIFRTGAYLFMPSNRAESPSWLNTGSSGSEPSPSFDPKITGQLRKPITATSTFNTIKSWLVDLILDQSIDSTVIVQRLMHGQPPI